MINLETNEPIEPIAIKTEYTNTTNCLALTVQEEHKFMALKNIVFKSIRISWKVAISTISLTILQLLC